MDGQIQCTPFPPRPLPRSRTVGDEPARISPSPLGSRRRCTDRSRRAHGRMLRTASSPRRTLRPRPVDDPRTRTRRSTGLTGCRPSNEPYSTIGSTFSGCRRGRGGQLSGPLEHVRRARTGDVRVGQSRVSGDQRRPGPATRWRPVGRSLVATAFIAIRDGGTVAAVRLFQGQPEHGISVHTVWVREYQLEQAEARPSRAPGRRRRDHPPRRRHLPARARWRGPGPAGSGGTRGRLVIEFAPAP